MRLSFAVCSHNEGSYLRALLEQLTEVHRIEQNEIVLLDDFSTDSETIEIIEEYRNLPVRNYERRLDKDFAAHKNYLNSLCRGQYIFQIDADELLAPALPDAIHLILDANPHVDLFYVPRVNRVEGLTQEHIAKWGWKVDEQGRVMWPDYQSRLFRNSPQIVWQGAVHETVVGNKTLAHLPDDEDYALIHVKSIARQEEQNRFYSTITR